MPKELSEAHLSRSDPLRTERIVHGNDGRGGAKDASVHEETDAAVPNLREYGLVVVIITPHPTGIHHDRDGGVVIGRHEALQIAIGRERHAIEGMRNAVVHRQALCVRDQPHNVAQSCACCCGGTAAAPCR